MAVSVEVAPPMGIRFSCPNGHNLHVKAFLAGKRGICPHCDVRFEIPVADTGRVPAFSSVAPASRQPVRGGLGTPALAAMAEVEGASPVGLEFAPFDDEPVYGRRHARSGTLPGGATKGKGLVICLSLLVAVLTAVLVFIVVYFGNG